MGALYGKGRSSYSTGIELELFSALNALESYCPILYKAALECDNTILFYTNQSIVVGKRGGERIPCIEL